MRPLLPWKSNHYYIFRVCVCSLRYLACKAHAPYCHLWPAHFENIFPHYLKNGTIFVKKVLNIKCVFRFSLKILPGTFSIVRRIQRDIIMNVYWSSLFLSCQILMKRKCSRQIFEKYSNIKFHKNPFSGSRMFPRGRTDRHD